MSKKYTRSKKEKLRDMIGELQAKEDYVTVLNIITKDGNVKTKESGNSTLMFFHALKDDTYAKLEKFVKSKLDNNEKLNKKKKENKVTYEYKPYTTDEYASKMDISPKLKLSNREKAIVNRNIHDNNLIQENGSDVIYREFSVDNHTETDHTEKSIDSDKN